jgi:AraC-like DNA-binding protein
MIYLAGSCLAFFLNLLLLGKKSKTLADKVLAFWLFVMMLHLAMFAFIKLTWYPQLLGLDLPLPILHGPLLYLYTIALTRNKITTQEWIVNGAVPVVFYIYLIPFILLPPAEKLFVYQNRGVGYEPFLAVRGLWIPVSGILYVTLSTLALRRHRRSIVREFSSLEKVNLLWLQYLIIWLAVIWLLVLFGNDDWVFGATVIFVFFIGYFGIRQAGIFHSLPDKSEDVPAKEHVEILPVAEEQNPSAQKYQKSGLRQESSALLQQQLSLLMSTERLYRNPELSLSELAERLNTQPNYLSQVINEREGKNFYEYVNSMRLAEFQLIASNPENKNLTLFAVAQQCGFNSKSSFNRYFKKVIGQSPSEYLQEGSLAEK